MPRIIHLFCYSVLLFFYTACSSSKSQQPIVANFANSFALKKHVETILSQQGFRNYLDTAVLNKVAGYIQQEFKEISSRISIQSYQVDGREYRNIICSLGPEDGERIIIGAHYDVCEDQSGADDNASGVAGLLELGRLLKDQPLKYRIDLVAYTLEEPPFFGTSQMGSYVHAKYLYDNKIPVKGMICLEMIGYFSDAPQSQAYPVGFLKWFYGTTGNYILIVQKFGNGTFGRQFNKNIRKTAAVKTKFLRSPKFITGVDFSDHRNYWHFGYNAVMVTNTAFYRNKNYHTSRDILQTLDLKRMAGVIDEVFLTITGFE